ncbi:hypothetical protein ACQJBY_060782 [Aegilops geniculata]
MKIVLWRLAHNCLPSGEQLCRRNVPAPAACAFCGRIESIEHALLFCHYARNVWDEVKNFFHVQLCRREFRSPKQWLFDFLSRCTDREATVMAVSIWHIWDARNSARNTLEVPTPRSTASKIRGYVDMIFEHIYKPVPVNRCETIASSYNWSPPPPGTVMLFSDAALFHDFNKSGAGVVALDHMGQCIKACTEVLSGPLTPEMAEALALRRAVDMAREEHLFHVIFATDCLSLVQRLKSKAHDRSVVGSVIDDIKMATLGFSSVSFVHVRRQCNVLAHVLARSCFNSSGLCVFNSAPECIQEALYDFVF